MSVDTIDAPAATATVLDPDRLRRLRALCDCASRDDCRPALTTVAFAADGHAWATDSYVMAAVPLAADAGELADGWDAESAPPVLVDGRQLKAALKAGKRQRLRLTFEAAGLRIDLFDALRFEGDEPELDAYADRPVRQSQTLPYVDVATYPRLWQLIPEPGEPAAVLPAFDRSNLDRVAACAPDHNGAQVVQLRAVDGLKPIRVEAASAGVGALVGIVMPVRV